MIKYALLIVAGLMLANGMPHLVSGLRGERFFTPWARPRGVGTSSALENALWGLANLALAASLLKWLLALDIRHGSMVVGVGFALGAVALSIIFGRRQGSDR